MMRRLLFLYALSCVECVDFFQSGKDGKKPITIERFDKTCGARTMPMMLEFTGLRIEDSIAYINATVTIREDMPTELRSEINIERCKTREDLNSCEAFHTINSETYYATLKVPGFYNNFIATFEPPYACPHKKGVYKTNRGKLDIRGIILFPTSGWYWKIKVEMIAKKTDRKMWCVNIEAKFA